jgi:hypothetical protein
LFWRIGSLGAKLRGRSTFVVFKPITEARKIGLIPKREPSQPVRGIAMADATM